MQRLTGGDAGGTVTLMPPAPSPVRPLLVTADPILLDEVLRIAAPLGVEVDVAHDVTAARRPWSSAPVVLVGCDLAPDLAAARLTVRDDVVLLTRGLQDGAVWELAVGVRADAVLDLPSGADALVDRLGTLDEPSHSPALVVGTVGGRGGAGSSALAAALAIVAARRSLEVLVVDADPLGGGLDLALGCEDMDGLRWPELAGARGRVSPRALASLVVDVDGVHLLAWDRGPLVAMSAEAITSVVSAGARGHDLVVVDLPRARDPGSDAAASLVDVLFVVVPAELRAVAAAERVRQRYAELVTDIRVLVRGAKTSGLEARAVAESLGLPLAGVMRAEGGLATSLEHGVAPGSRSRGPLAVQAARLLDALGLDVTNRSGRSA